MKEYDIIVYGASGLTARFAIERLLQEDKRIALAGRSSANIKKNIAPLDIKQDIDILEVSIDKIDDVTSKTKVLVNCCGPYILTGERIVKSCIENKTHYLDVTGETIFVDSIIEKYNDLAKRNGVFIINYCGFDSIPADVGFEYLKRSMNVEDFTCKSVISAKDTTLNVGTYDSLVHSLEKMNILSELRKITNKPNKVKRRNESMKTLSYNGSAKSYCVLFMGPDMHVVRKTQATLEEYGLGKSGDYSAYFSVGSLVNLMMLMFFVSLIYIFSRFKSGVKLLLKYPGFFSCNLIKRGGPSLNEIKKASFSVTFWGSGVSESGQIVKNQLIIDGPDPAYMTASTCLVQCTMVLLNMLQDKQNGIKNNLSVLEGGIFTPASVFQQTDLVQRLCLKGINFKIV